METAPYNTPPALAREPFTAAFWTLCAPFLFPVIGAFLIGLVWPGFNQVINGDERSAESIGQLWTALAAIHLVHLQFAHTHNYYQKSLCMSWNHQELLLEYPYPNNHPTYYYHWNL